MGDKLNNIYGLAQKIEIRLFTNYLFFAGFATIVDFVILFGLTEFAGLWYFYSAAVAYVFGTLTNYTLNKFFNFRNRSTRYVRQFGVFVSVATVGLLLNQALLFVFVEFFGIWYMFARFISVFIVVFWSFYGHKKLTFNLFK